MEILLHGFLIIYPVAGFFATTVLLHWRFSLRKTAYYVPPAGYDRIRVVDSFDELVTSAFGPEVNAICWPRLLAGDFDELARRFSHEEEIISLDEDCFSELRPGLSDAGRAAANALLEDQRLLRALGLSPGLECVPRYQRDETSVVPTDVYSFHADRATVPTDTYLCSYNEAATEGLRNDQAQRRIDMPAIRAELLALFQQEQEAGDFDSYLMENCYDLHYAALAEADPFSFGIGHLWRLAVEYPGCPVPPCLHRAPKTMPARPPRLLLISEWCKSFKLRGFCLLPLSRNAGEEGAHAQHGKERESAAA
jgi:hypothetical protein